MSEASQGSPGRKSGRWFFLVGCVLLSALGWHFGLERIGALLRNAEPAPLIGMAVLIVVGFWARALKWHHALGKGGQGILLFFIAKTAGNWTPGRAGELAPLLLKQHRTARVAAWIGLDRAIEVSLTLGLGLLGAASLGLVSPGAWIILVVLAAGGSWVLLKLGRVDQETSNTPEPITPSGWRSRLRGAGKSLRLELALFVHKLPVCLGLTVLAKITDVYAVIYLCDAFGYHTGFLLVCAARCAHGLVSAIPVTPDATGVPYVAAAWMLHEYAGIPFEALTTALALEVIAINAILWVCFCLVSAGRWTSTSTE